MGDNKVMPPQTLIRLQAQNVKRLSAVNIYPDGSLVVIGGKNGAGKSTVLDSIAMLFGGKDAIPEMPIRRGKARAQIVGETQDLIVTRKFSANGASQLVVTTKENVPLSSPQTILDRLTGSLTFDPMSFSVTAEKEPKKALEILRKLVGLDFTDLDNERATHYTERTAVNRDIKQKQGQITSFPFFADAGDTEVTTADLLKKLEEAQAVNAKNNAARTNVSFLHGETNKAASMVHSKSAEIEQLRKQLAAAELALTSLDEAFKAALKAEEDARAKIASLVDADETAIKSEMATVDQTNERIRANKQRKKLQDELATLQLKESSLTSKIEKIDQKKKDMLASAKFPLPQLSFDDVGVLLDGVPFAQGSAAERLRASIAIGMALNPTLRVVLIRDASLMDSDSMNIVAEMAQEHGFQVWLERVGNGPEVSVIIEDGHIQGESPEIEE